MVISLPFAPCREDYLLRGASICPTCAPYVWLPFHDAADVVKNSFTRDVVLRESAHDGTETGM